MPSPVAPPPKTYVTPPALGGLFWQTLWAKKPRLVPAGATVPRIEARWTQPRLDARHLAAYRELCGFTGDELPLTYPHVMVSALHLAMLASPEFPVRLLGIVHLGNRIELLEPLPTTPTGEFVAWLEGHEEDERAQRFALHTEWRDGGRVRWRETSTFIARKAFGSRGPPRPPEPRPLGASRTEIHVPSGLGRRYSRLGGDINPIHLWDVTAKLFGFKQAIVHGMWSLGRCVAVLAPRGPCVVDVQFKQPVTMPSKLLLERVRRGDGEDFALLDEAGVRPHLVGTLRLGAPAAARA